MKSGRTNIYLGIVCFFIVLCVSVQGYGAEQNGSVLAKKTLTRWVDPVVAPGTLVKEVNGATLSGLRLYAFKDGVFKPIRYQIEEMTKEDGDWVYLNGPVPNAELSNGKLDTWDKIVFMAEDTGDRVSKQAWTPGNTRGSEIEATDPLTGGKGWVYVLYFASNPPAPSSEPNYVNYDYKTEKIWSDSYGMNLLINEEGRHMATYTSMWVTKEAGGSGENFIDRFKGRVTLKAFFKAVTISFRENKFCGDTMCYNAGPIRITRRYDLWVHIPGGMKAVRVVSDVNFYRDVEAAPYQIKLPFKVGTVLSSAVISMGTDYDPLVIGKAKLYNSNNPQGCLITGHMDDCKKNWNPEYDHWRMISGDFGTYMARGIMPADAMKYVKVKMEIIDDITKKDPPEVNPGNIGFLHQDWELKDLPGGTYTPLLEWYYPAHFKPEVIVQYTNMSDTLLRVQGGGQETANQLYIIVSNLDKKYKGMWEKKYKETQ